MHYVHGCALLQSPVTVTQTNDELIQHNSSYAGTSSYICCSLALQSSLVIRKQVFECMAQLGDISSQAYSAQQFIRRHQDQPPSYVKTTHNFQQTHNERASFRNKIKTTAKHLLQVRL